MSRFGRDLSRALQMWERLNGHAGLLTIDEGCGPPPNQRRQRCFRVPVHGLCAIQQVRPTLTPEMLEVFEAARRSHARY